MTCMCVPKSGVIHVDVINWKHFPRYWPFVRGIHRSPHKGQWRRALMFSLMWAWINGYVNNREAGYLRRHRAHYDATFNIIFAIGNIPYSVTFICIPHKEHILTQPTNAVTEYLINNIVDVRMPFADTSVRWGNFTNDLVIAGREI